MLMRNYKLSNYNYYRHGIRFIYIYNTKSGLLCKLSKNEYNKLKKNKLNDIEELGKLIDAGFLVYENVNELNELEELFNQSRYSKEEISITFAPTLNCNFNCAYCYEQKSLDQMKKDNFWQKLIKPKRFLLILGSIIIVVGLFGGGILSYLISREEAINLRKVNKENTFTQIDVELVTSYFATLTTDTSLEKYYFITDSEGYTYIAKIDDQTFKSLKANYDYNYSTDINLATPELVTIYGNAEKIPKSIKNFAIEYLQEDLGLTEVNADNFNSVIYPYLINTYVSKTDTIIDIAIIFGLITIVGLLILMFYINRQAKNKKILNKYRRLLPTIEEELKQDNTIDNQVCKIFLTDNYLVSYNKELKIIPLNDIIWLYPFEYQSKGIATKRSVCLVTKDKQKYNIGSISNIGKNKDKEYNEMYHLLLKRTPEALHGYSKENKDKVENRSFKIDSK